VSKLSCLEQPERRPLRIYAFDPMPGRAPDQLLWRTSENQITVNILNEGLKPGPQGDRIEVIDYDGASNCFYSPVNLDDPALLMQDGLAPSESDPRFHQQMVYAVAMKVLENFDHALGRKLRFRGRRVDKRYNSVRLRIFPHAFRGANAFYDPKHVALLFGYFQADRENPGENLPGQTVFTCLSHDVIAHEMTHALVDRLRRFFKEPSNADVFAFHEGFSDIVAIFQHFSFTDILRTLIQESKTDLRRSAPLIELARQFGYATGSGEGLRVAVEKERPDPRLYQTAHEPHNRGSILVAAVFDAFFMTYQRRIKDLIRIATGGTGRLPEGELHPDLVNRIAQEASQAAQSILTMCIRAFDYLPPVDITFGDYLRALVTTDIEISPGDEFCERSSMIEAFRLRGIYPAGVTALAEGSLLWEPVEEKVTFPRILKDWMDEQVIADAQAFKRDAPPPRYKFPEVATDFSSWAKDNASLLNLNPRLPIKSLGFHPSFRVGSQGQLLLELVMQFVQEEPGSAATEEFGGVAFRGGTTVVASAGMDDRVRYVISKPLPHKGLGTSRLREAKERRDRQLEFVARSDRHDPALTWLDQKSYQMRMARRMDFAAMHRRIML
jgi:hypothetical protein